MNGPVPRDTGSTAVEGAAKPVAAAFGRLVIGPILADAVYRLYRHLHASTTHGDTVALFCARGGLTIRRFLEAFAERVGLGVRVRLSDFMVSRLAAARTALQVDPAAVAALIEMEWSGRSCAEVAFALTGEGVQGNPEWQAPFSLRRFDELTRVNEVGKRILAINHEQANLLRQHVEQLRGESERITICDTGVFGSIVRYLQVGMPEVQWRSALLFRANYKRLASEHFEATTGVVSQSNIYQPWQPQTAALLYWPLVESILEPRVSSVRHYRARPDGRIASDMEVDGWRERLAPADGSILAGAFDHIGGLTEAALPSIQVEGRAAWRRLRTMIVHPTIDDVALLAVGRRDLDFGMSEAAEFSARIQAPAHSFGGKLAAVRASMWPEGELRKQFQRRADLLLHAMEIGRWIRAIWVSEGSGDVDVSTPTSRPRGDFGVGPP